MIYKTIGDRLKYSLNIRKLTQKEFAQRTNITESAMSRYISGERVPRADTIVSICRSLGVSADWLLGMTELETWEGIHAQVTAPKGTFDKIWNEAEDNDEI